MFDIVTQQMKDKVTRLGVTELQTAEEVDSVLNHAGTTLVFVNSVCGCAGGIARPALSMALTHNIKPDQVTTVFASTDREATMRARAYFTGMPPSSPSFALLRDGRLVEMLHRSDIENCTAGEVAGKLTALFDKYCAAVPQ